LIFHGALLATASSICAMLLGEPPASRENGRLACCSRTESHS
jgi:hypothetical protein